MIYSARRYSPTFPSLGFAVKEKENHQLWKRVENVYTTDVEKLKREIDCLI